MSKSPGPVASPPSSSRTPNRRLRSTKSHTRWLVLIQLPSRVGTSVPLARIRS